MSVLNAERMQRLYDLLDEAAIAAAHTAEHDQSSQLKRIARAQVRLIERDKYSLWRHRDMGEMEGEHVCRSCFDPSGVKLAWPCTETRIVADYWLRST